MFSEQKLINRIEEISERIVCISIRIESEINNSEISKLNKSKSKLLKEKRKAINKLYPPDRNDE